MICKKTNVIVIIFCLFFSPSACSSSTSYIYGADGISLTSETIFEIQTIDTHILQVTDVETELYIDLHQYPNTIAIIVQNSIYTSIASAVNQYRKDLNDTGYRTILYTSPLTKAEALKGNLSEWYTSEGLIGAVLIGRLPYAQFYHDATSSFASETFICDLFLMDLDGTWTDTSPSDGIYDQHYASTGTDIYPEIFIGRIDPTCLSWGTVTDNINAYLSRIHDYRTGGVVRQRSALFYIDDDWAGYWGSTWSSDGALAYSTRTLVQTPTTYTNATDWLTNRILQNYQWGHLCAHSSETTHYFGPSGSGEGTVSSTQIHNSPPSFNFYNLFCCSGAEWTHGNNLAVTYTFSGSYSLASIGSSKTGSMMDCDEFYGPLGENKTLGQSLAIWFSNSLTMTSTAGNEYLPWYYGMNIVGDPLLTIHYDCTVLSPSIQSMTHPNQTLWYSNQRPQLNWTVPADVNDIIGYYYVVNSFSNTIPTKENGIYTTVNGTITDEDLPSGTWYYHVVAVDSEGNVGKEAAHYTVHIDVTGPNLSISHPVSNGYHCDSALTATWTSTDQHSGYNWSIIWIDSSTNIIYNGSLLECILTGLSEGYHILNVTTFDTLQNRATKQITFYVDLTDPTLEILEPLDGASVTASVFLDWTVEDTGSGYSHSEVYLDDTLLDRVDSPNTSYQINDLVSGSHTIDVVAYDWASRFSSQSITITIESVTSTNTTTTTTSGQQLPSIIIIQISIVLVAILAVIAIFLWKRH